jgi:hypothetical protein
MALIRARQASLSYKLSTNWCHRGGVKGRMAVRAKADRASMPEHNLEH